MAEKLTSTILVLSTSTTTDDESRHPDKYCSGLVDKPAARAVVLRGAMAALPVVEVVAGTKARSVNDSDPPAAVQRQTASSVSNKKWGRFTKLQCAVFMFCCSRARSNSSTGSLVRYGISE